MTITLGTVDIIIIVAFFAAVIAVGRLSKKSDATHTSYLVAGRAITLPAFVATLVSSFYGGILGIGEFTYRYGISSWFLNAFPYYLFITIFAIFLSGKVRRTKLYTIPDKLMLAYGKPVSITGAVLIFFLITPAPYVFMLGIIFQLIFKTSLFVSMLICILISISFLYKGGLNADVKVNILEFIMMYLGFGIILPFCFMAYGGPQFLTDNLKPEFLILTGGKSAQFIIVWFFIGLWAIVDPTFHQRCYAAKSEKTARTGVFISLIFWIIFDLMTTTAGLYAAGSIKHLDNPAMSYPVLADNVLPQVAKGFFYVGMLATILSTLHSNLFISATTIGRDIIGNFRNGKTDDKNYYSKLGIIIASAVSLCIPLFIPSVVDMWYTLGTITIPGLLVAVVSSYFLKLKINSKFILISMIGSAMVSLIWLLIGIINKSSEGNIYPFGIEPLYPGLIVGMLFYFIGFVIKLRIKEKD
ncbi:MAG TPA: sodium:solute symporter family protein [Ignavibacteria bacterium]|nr:sodium:solute symporter family protein [Ignavibacteria bacterium]